MLASPPLSLATGGSERVRSSALHRRRCIRRAGLHPCAAGEGCRGGAVPNPGAARGGPPSAAEWSQGAHSGGRMAPLLTRPCAVPTARGKYANLNARGSVLLLVNSIVIGIIICALRGIYYALLEEGAVPVALTGMATGLISMLCVHARCLCSRVSGASSRPLLGGRCRLPLFLPGTGNVLCCRRWIDAPVPPSHQRQACKSEQFTDRGSP